MIVIQQKGLRVSLAIIFMALCLLVMVFVYKLSSENGTESNLRSETVTETFKQEITVRLNDRGLALSERVKYFVILHSPYGSDWNANIRKLAHFTIYGLLASMIYILLTILGMHKIKRFLLTMVVCFVFALADELHQRYTGRTSSFRDVLIDTTGAFTACSFWTAYSWFCMMIRSVVKNIRKNKMEEEC